VISSAPPVDLTIFPPVQQAGEFNLQTIFFSSARPGKIFD
jgi:hypothetical protein